MKPKNKNENENYGILAWHFIGPNMKRAGSRERPWHVGEKRTMKGRIEMCVRGYHSSMHPADAVRHSTSQDILTRVRVSSIVDRSIGKQVSRTRELLVAVPFADYWNAWKIQHGYPSLNNPRTRTKFLILCNKVIRDHLGV